MNNADLLTLARAGAQARLNEIEVERSDSCAIFPA